MLVNFCRGVGINTFTAIFLRVRNEEVGEAVSNYVLVAIYQLLIHQRLFTKTHKNKKLTTNH
ncbi:hypothetical protein H1P_1410020 [Hyella patelloides LEGE 07179]|uniref:Uncharacterized protein n=1 Tax=Hyella patelloides LEGE 07179 TaxID=945734 RepID=A0A563VLX0_9CYAN|nr:hypothetical protein H1P_1410020 [Hyella patelloides LEGE 07179]